MVTDTEIRLLQIWKTILGVEAITYDVGFLNAGGDSISATLCISKVWATFGVELSIEDFFFDDATVKSLAGRIDFLRSGAWRNLS